jgi:hypothetical protein
MWARSGLSGPDLGWVGRRILLHGGGSGLCRCTLTRGALKKIPFRPLAIRVGELAAILVIPAAIFDPASIRGFPGTCGLLGLITGLASPAARPW